jgi:hypothetical protein
MINGRRLNNRKSQVLFRQPIEERREMTKIKSRPMVVLVLCMLWSGILHAQKSVNASGGDADGNSGSVAYSIGQFTYSVDTGLSGKITQGVQHAFEIFTMSNNNVKLNISLSVFPNPTSDYLFLEIPNYNSEYLNCKIYDMLGKVLSHKEIRASETKISLIGLPAATYFVDVINQENKRLQSFKIIKK